MAVGEECKVKNNLKYIYPSEVSHALIPLRSRPKETDRTRFHTESRSGSHRNGIGSVINASLQQSLTWAAVGSVSQVITLSTSRQCGRWFGGAGSEVMRNKHWDGHARGPELVALHPGYSRCSPWTSSISLPGSLGEIQNLTSHPRPADWESSF